VVLGWKEARLITISGHSMPLITRICEASPGHFGKSTSYIFWISLPYFFWIPLKVMKILKKLDIASLRDI
jgi:hypothetical protein